MKKTTLFIMPLTLTLLACGNPNQAEKADETADATVQQAQKAGNEQTTAQTVAMDVIPKKFAQLMEEKDAIVLDVRTDREVAEGVIPGAQQMDYRSGEFKSRVKELDKSKPVLVYCAVGGRSGAAMEIMAEMGFSEVYNLAGGINKWKAEGRPVEPLAK